MVINEVVRSLNDFCLIADMSAELFSELHKRDAIFIATELAASAGDGKTIVVTHHLPCYRCIHPKFAEAQLTPDLLLTWMN